MKRKLPSTISNKAVKLIYPVTAIAVLLIIWQTVCSLGWVPKYLLPSPVDIIKALIDDFPLLMSHASVTVLETFIGLALGIVIGFFAAVLMDRFSWIYKAFYPLIIITQTIPTVAIAPLLVLWFGYEMTPKVILIVLVVFFPITVSMLDGFKAADTDTINLLRSMGADNVSSAISFTMVFLLTPKRSASSR